MKKSNARKTISFWLTGCMIIALVLSVSSFAADFPRRMDAEKRSEKDGLGRDKVSLLKRMPGRGREAVSDNLIQHFKDSKSPVSTKGAAKKQRKGDRLSVIGDGWFLDVNRDGTNVRYRNYKYLDGKPELAKPVAARLTNEKLEELGRVFIKEHLAEYIKLENDEELVPFFTQHAIGFVGQTNESAATIQDEKVYASTVIFTRTVNQLNIIGPGSKIAIMFNNENEPIGFDYDWPQYKAAGKYQKVLPVEAIKNRAKKLTSLNIDSPDVKVKRFDCGLYDAGARKHDPKSVVQAACAIHSYQKTIMDEKAHKIDQRSGHIVAAYTEFIPAGDTVEQDEKWPQAMKLLNNKQVSIFAAPKDGPKPK